MQYYGDIVFVDWQGIDYISSSQNNESTVIQLNDAGGRDENRLFTRSPNFTGKKLMFSKSRTLSVTAQMNEFTREYNPAGQLLTRWADDHEIVGHQKAIVIV
jgi:hypothetical protein